MNQDLDRTPHSLPRVPPPHRPAAASNPGGSLGAGIGWFFGCLVGAGIAGTGIMYLSSVMDPTGRIAEFSAPFAMALPWLAMIVLAIRLARAGKPRTALGILLGFGIFVALILLLVAACFGLFGGLGNMH